MKKKLLIAALAALCVICCAAAFAACDDPEGAATVTENDTFKTESRAIWVIVGEAYLSFEKIPQPAQPVEGELYGNVFKVYATGDSNPPTPWLTGTWGLEISEEGTPGTLTITANWQDGDNITKLTDAQSGVAKTYEPNEEGKYEIKVDFPSAAGLAFELDPGADKVTAESGGADAH